MSNGKTAEHPAPRWGHNFVYDQARQQALLFGGASKPGTFLGDTWLWDGATWTQQQVDGPPARGFAAAAFDNGRNTIILHGGRGNGRNTCTDTWEWDGTAWHQLEETGPYQADHHQMVYIAHEQRLMAYGGWTGQGVSGQSWFWNGRWQAYDGDGPPKRAAYGLAYDSQQERVVLYGGLWVHGQYADLWQWQGNRWQQLGGHYDNSSLDHHNMVFDNGRHQVILFGGKNYRYVPSGHTRTIEGHLIVPITAEGPTPRHSFGLTCDTHQNRLLLFGGKAFDGLDKVPLDDLWSWDGTQWVTD